MYSDVQLSDAEIAYQAAHTHDTKGPSIIAANAVLAVLATMAVTLRFVVRWHTKSRLKADDYTIFLAWVYLGSHTVAELYANLHIDLVLGFFRLCLLWYHLPRPLPRI